ncbi:MAG: Trm112 family protein [Gammaproteobacteria bacterium]|nr:Trm112 family protein [Gammaproteobacteria bacterium]
MPVSPKLLELLVCPASKGRLVFSDEKGLEELWCYESGLAYPIEDSIPRMIESQARELTNEERSALRGRQYPEDDKNSVG